MIPKSPKERKPPFFTPAEKSTFDVLLYSVDTMRKLMFKDLQVGIEGGANFLVAGALNTYTEIWGKLLEGIPKEQSKQCYESFFRRLGRCYANLLDEGVQVYGEVRCGLIHAYTIGGTLAIVNMGTGQCGIQYDMGKYTFNIGTYFEDFKTAVDEYIVLLKQDLPVQSPSYPGYTGNYPVKNPLHLNLYEALSHKSVLMAL